MNSEQRLVILYGLPIQNIRIIIKYTFSSLKRKGWKEKVVRTSTDGHLFTSANAIEASVLHKNEHLGFMLALLS